MLSSAGDWIVSTFGGPVSVLRNSEIFIVLPGEPCSAATVECLYLREVLKGKGLSLAPIYKLTNMEKQCGHFYPLSKRSWSKNGFVWL